MEKNVKHLIRLCWFCPSCR